MLHYRIALSAAACLVAAASVFAEEPPCATNYHSAARSAETFVTTGLAPAVVIERLPGKLAAAGVSMQWSDPAKGTLKAEGLEVKAAAAGDGTRVIFNSSVAADKTTLCRYAALVGNPPPPPAPAIPQDQALIALMKEDLIKKHQILRDDSSNGLNWAVFRSLADFLEFTVLAIKQDDPVKRQYAVSLLLPRTTCGLAAEDVADATAGLLGGDFALRTKPVRVLATLVYTNDGHAWQFKDAWVDQIESTK